MWEAQNEGPLMLHLIPHLPSELALPYCPTDEGGAWEVQQLALQMIHSRAGINAGPSLSPTAGG